jgi:L-iditol 2-dehydrogenase
MKIAVVTAPGAVELREEPRPELGADDVLVEVGACGLCTMERRLFAGEKQMYPVAPGHEAAGHVVEVGSGVAGLPGVPEVGDRVSVDLLTRCGACDACRRGHTALCTPGTAWSSSAPATWAACTSRCRGSLGLRRSGSST